MGRALMPGALLMGCVYTPTEAVSPSGAACTVDDAHVSCPFTTVPFWKGITMRQGHVQVPAGDPPTSGWPTVLFFQGSFHTAEDIWVGEVDDALGGFHQARLVAQLLDDGYAVVAPEAEWDGALYWETNAWPTSFWWESGDDHPFIQGVFAAIDDGSLGPLNPDALYATGISSGGYMTSRMAMSYPGRMRALAIQSASYATCAGVLCVPGAIPEDHPPTLFLHGEEDPVVPIHTMELYADALTAAGIETDQERDPTAGHAWIAVAPERVSAWFLDHPAP